MNARPFADVLKQYVDLSGYTLGHLAKLSNIPKATIVNWLEGRVKRPRVWQDIARVCSVLELTEEQATEVLEAGGHPSVPELMALASAPDDIKILSAWGESVRGRRAQAPFQAIEDLPHFVGREQELQSIKEALLAGRHVTLYSLEGMPGVGKTILAAHLAYQLRPYFVDGVLWASLSTSDTMSILSAFANAYGRDVSRYDSISSRSQVVREVLANKRALIVLDDAQVSEQVEPLLPPTGMCAVIITTRRHNLAPIRSARRFRIDVFDRKKEESLELFARILGPERVR